MAIYRETAQHREAERQQAIRQRFDRAWKVARQGANLLKEQFGAQKVIVFGSLVHPELFHERSDIDLVAWGMVEKAYLPALSALLSLDEAFEIELVPVEEAKPSIYQTIIQEGQVL